MNKSENVYLSIGSNLGDRESNLAQAITALGINYDITDVHSASFYDTEPLYFTEQEYFLNTVVGCITSLNPFDLLDVTRRIEQMLGRPKIREKKIYKDEPFHNKVIKIGHEFLDAYLTNRGNAAENVAFYVKQLVDKEIK